MRLAVACLALWVACSPGASLAQVRCEAGGSSQVSEVFTQVNALRAKAGLKPLRMDSRLTRAAQQHGCEMRAAGFFAHASPTTGSVGDRTKRAGYTWCTVAENLAKGQNTPDQAVQGWMSSTGHRRNILNGAVVETGVAFIPEGPDGGPYWIQVFAAPC
jgi:uncharacterized protein YkwD